MATYSVSIYDQPTCETLVDIAWCDSYDCMTKVLHDTFHVQPIEIAGQRNIESMSISWGAHPGGAETDYDVYCAWCACFMWEGLRHGITCHVEEMPG